MMSSEKPLLPSLAAILYGEKPNSEPCSPLLENMNTSFCSDSHGVIRLPPLNNGISRPRSVDSAVRQTVTNGIQPVDESTARMRAHSLPDNSQASQVQQAHANVAPPSTPVVKKKAASQSGKKADMLTPLSAARAIITPSANDKKRAFAFITHSQETFPTKEPKIDNAPLARRKRRRTSTQELNILQAEFDMCSAPDKRKRQELAERCNMSEKAVQIWFQNRRQAIKKQRNSAALKSKVTSTSIAPVASGLTCSTGHIASTPAKPRSTLASSTTVSSSTEPSMADRIESSKEHIPENVTEGTPTSLKNINTPQSTATNTPLLRLPNPEEKEQEEGKEDTKEEQNDQEEPELQQREEKSSSQENFTPTRASLQNNIKRGQALTFHLTSDKKVLTPLKISPNNRVNKLINGANAGSPCKRKSTTASPSSMVKMDLTPTKKNPLKELNTNTMVH